MQFQKVNDPAKIVTDPVLLAALAGQGIDKDGVELWHDYAPCALGKGYSPYAKFYRDLNSSRQYMVVSGLPMVDAYGQPHDLAWRAKNSRIESGNNIFHAVVEGNTTRLIALSDQPDGTKKDAEVCFHPQLFIGGGEVQPLSPLPLLLETDPVNPEYHHNVLEWDYGVCRRRIRIIEGRYLGSWVFTSVPLGDVLIRYNQQGGLRLRLQHPIGIDEEYLPGEYFSDRELPVVIADSAAFYPDANPETSSVDGNVLHNTGGYGTGIVWSSLVAAAGNLCDDATNTFVAMGLYSDTVSARWRTIYRGIVLFNTASLPDDAIISAASLSLYGYAKADSLSCSPNINIYSSNPASNNALAGGDYAGIGTAHFCDTPITYSGWSNAGYNDFSLNASGLAGISKTGVSKFGVRNASYDVANSSPAWVSAVGSNMQCYASERGTGYKPRLVVTYSLGTAVSSGDSGAGAESSSLTAGELKISGDAGSGNEAICLRNFSVAESGSGTENALAQKQVIAGDAGAGAETSDLEKSLLGSTVVGSDMKLHVHRGRVGFPHKEVNI